ncbi:hypothetical protein cyc_01770 [Cyclospora cayetanensis]|uniref:Uncharacterized protein n=1 Tax=Cyclospora cayetanensis TaxID=88456 RepID=A0A1D3D135_9EIME|nr:hypothetical protein cyc_01770 [Cyclospora cayetanensis]
MAQPEESFGGHAAFAAEAAACCIGPLAAVAFATAAQQTLQQKHRAAAARQQLLPLARALAAAGGPAAVDGCISALLLQWECARAAHARAARLQQTADREATEEEAEDVDTLADATAKGLPQGIEAALGEAERFRGAAAAVAAASRVSQHSAPMLRCTYTPCYTLWVSELHASPTHPQTTAALAGAAAATATRAAISCVAVAVEVLRQCCSGRKEAFALSPELRAAVAAAVHMLLAVRALALKKPAVSLRDAAMRLLLRRQQLLVGCADAGLELILRRCSAELGCLRLAMDVLEPHLGSCEEMELDERPKTAVEAEVVALEGRRQHQKTKRQRAAVGSVVAVGGRGWGEQRQETGVHQQQHMLLEGVMEGCRLLVAVGSRVKRGLTCRLNELCAAVIAATRSITTAAAAAAAGDSLLLERMQQALHAAVAALMCLCGSWSLKHDMQQVRELLQQLLQSLRGTRPLLLQHAQRELPEQVVTAAAAALTDGLRCLARWRCLPDTLADAQSAALSELCEALVRCAEGAHPSVCRALVLLLMRLWTSHGVAFVAAVPHCMQGLSELLETAEEDTEALLLRLIREIEATTGMTLSDNLKA